MTENSDVTLTCSAIEKSPLPQNSKTLTSNWATSNYKKTRPKGLTSSVLFRNSHRYHHPLLH